MKKAIFTLLFFTNLVASSFNNNCFSQHEIRPLNTQKTSVINQSNPELHSKTIEFSNEVYRDCPEYTTPDILKIYSTQIYQVEIITTPSTESLTFPLLSTIPLRNKCNPELIKDAENFDGSVFNPLKYMFNYSTYTDQYFIVDNTNYVIHIGIKN